jgi:hypothetical protein
MTRHDGGNDMSGPTEPAVHHEQEFFYGWSSTSVSKHVCVPV